MKALKDKLRKAALKRRDALVAVGASASLCRHFLQGLPLRRGMVVAGYWPMGSEIDPRPLLLKLHGRGCLLALPVAESPGMPLTFRRWSPGDPLEPGPHGTQHPKKAAPEVVPSLVLVPLLAFDRKGFRLGYGGGYYDRTLAALKYRGRVMAVGLAYGGQEVRRLPQTRHDIPLDLVVTDKGLR